MDTLRKTLFGSIACLLVLTTSGCNTFKGMGKDIQKGGEKVENTAAEAQEEIRENKNK